MALHPNPQFAREDYILLDGEWEFEITNFATVFYWQPRLWEKDALGSKINVPFPVESKLSGVEDKEFNILVWYRKTFTLPKSWDEGHVILNFGAVDYECTIWVNKKQTGTHVGGYSPFKMDITPYLREGENEIFVRVKDDCTDPKVPSGKQSPLYKSFAALYTRNTGIWQSVWLERVGEVNIESVRFTTKNDGNITFALDFSKSAVECEVACEVTFEGAPVYSAREKVTAIDYTHSFKIEDVKLWGVGEGNLYDCKLTLFKNDETVDNVYSYFGVREVGFKDNAFVLNGKPTFLRLALDQGYYPEGIYSAPDEKALLRDIDIALDAGFNGCRLHEKVFDPKYLYFADKKGFLTWGEYPNFGLSINKIESLAYILPEWLAVLKRDVNHPSIVTWCPFNETETNDYKSGELQCEDVIKAVYTVTKAFDSSRPVVDVSGSMHPVTGKTDIYDVHDYAQEEQIFRAHYGKGYYELFPDKQARRDEPYMVTEFGGILWDETGSSSWGYGSAPKTKEEFMERFEMMVETLLSNPDCTGFCYTQLYDVEQEKNGLYTYERTPKFDMKKIKAIVTKKAKIE